MKSKYLEGRGRCLTLFFLCFIMYSVVYMTKNMFSAAMASIVEEGFMTKSETGAISAAFWLVYGVFQIFGGFAADKFPTSLLICIGLAGGAVSNLVIYLNQSYAVIIAVWMFNAAAQFGIWPSIFRIVSVELAPCYRSAAVFWILFSSTFGSGLSMLMASLVERWQDNFLLSFIFLTALIVIWIAVYTPLGRKMVTEHTETEQVVQTDTADGGIMKLMLTSGLAVIVVIGFLRGCTDSAIRMVTPTMLMESYSDLPAAISTRLSIILVVVAALGFFVGSFIQKHVTAHEMKASLILAIACVIPIALTSLVGEIHYLFILAFLSVDLMLLQSMSLFTTSKSAKRFARYGKSGTAAGILNAALSFANVVGSFVFPTIAEISSWRVVTVIWLALLLLDLALILAVCKRWGRFIENNNE